MSGKRSFKNPYHQTQSELAEWLVLFAQDYSTTQVANALVERYPERSTGDSKTDHRWAKEAVCTVNPNDSRYNAEKWANQYGLMQANCIKEREKSVRQLASKSVTALNAAYDNLNSMISDLSPKEYVSLVPKAQLTLSQAVKNVNPPASHAEQKILEEDAEAERKAQMLADIEILIKQRSAKNARTMLREGNSFEEISKQKYVDVDEIKNDLARKRVEDEVIGMIKSGLNREEIQGQTELPYAYIDCLMDHPDEDRIYRFAIQDAEPQTNSAENGNGKDLVADSGAARNLN